MPTKSWVRSKFRNGYLRIAVALLCVVAFFAIGSVLVFNSNKSVLIANHEEPALRHQIIEIRDLLNKSSIEVQLIPRLKPENVKLFLPEAASAMVEIEKKVAAVCQKKGHTEPDGNQDFEKLCNEFLKADQVDFAVLKSGIQTSGEVLPHGLEGLVKALEMKKEILSRMEKSTLAQGHDAFESKVLNFVVILLPVAVAILVIPLAILIASSKKLKRGLANHIRSLDELSGKNEKSSERLRTASELMSTASTQQSAAIQQTSSSIVQIRTMLSETEKRVREVQEIGTEMDSEAGGGREIMHKMEQSMLAIEETNKQIQSFEEILNQIESKTKVINDIVFKTQLLSFNASIEAARAGQYGRGFSVVAEEVGKLAMLSGDAATEIDQLLGQSADRVSKIVASVTEKVREGKVVSQDAFVRFGDLANRAKLISVKVDQVAHATTEQSGGIDQTVRAMEQVKIAAVENKKAADEVHRIADSVFGLSAQIMEVIQTMNRYGSGRGRQVEVEEQTAADRRSEDTAVRESAVARSQRMTVSESLATKVEVTPSDAERETSRHTGSNAASRKSQRAPAKVVSVASRRSISQVSADDPSFKKVDS